MQSSSRTTGVLISARAKRVYVGVTIAYLLVSAGFAAAGVWVVAVAFLAMGGAMTAASMQMRTRGSEKPSERNPSAARRPQR